MNANQELIEHLEDKPPVIFIDIKRRWNYDTAGVVYSGRNLQDALNHTHFEYHSGFGSQYLFGTIWYADGTWSSRGEYDGSEWWEYNKCPPIPEVG
jgi:hypothetical protein